ncbi:ATPase [Xenorhabdus mauleonii]|uniref:ATPase n=1 Tax=Xenorhabdus mauleonii TaxID=351675 RepID=A0A1I3WN36_9GAMM|nr:AAA family ATPase [Xenorhabdus mauleonii]PHM39289.1 ATPase [Xenorhabdus mauleonii]SFK08770.1 Primase C terminal 2 (PriCT-2) [Xenorhabdus mauleonii]
MSDQKQKIYYSVGRNAKDSRPVAAVADSFVEYQKAILALRKTINIKPSDPVATVRNKKSLLNYIWGSMLDSLKGRNAANAGSRRVLWLDMDGCSLSAWNSVIKVLKLYQCFAYTTASHGHPTANREQRWRLGFLLSRDVSASEYQLLGPQIEREIMDCYELLGDEPVKWDRSVYEPSHMVFAPDENAVSESFNGVIIDVELMLAPNTTAVIETEVLESVDCDDLERSVELHRVNQHTFEHLRDALWFPQILPLAEDYSSWIAMGNRLSFFKDSEFEDEAKQLWHDWSASSDKYDHEITEQKWQEHLTADRTGYAAIFKQAQDRGWVNPGVVEEIDLPVSTPHMGGYGKPGRFIVEGFIPEGVTAIYGQSSAFKSYLALSIALRIAMMRHRWAGRNLKGGAVLYIAAEGGSSIYPRVGAWADRLNDGKPVNNFYILPRAVDLADPKMVKALSNEIKRIINASGHPVRMVVIDTLSQSMTSGDENSAGDMARFMAGATRVSTESGAAVVVVHHSGKDGSKGMRGSSAAFANVDAVIRVDRIEDSVNLINEKQRTGPTQPTASYNVPVVDLPDYVIVENGAFDNEYTSTEGEVYSPVRLTTERVFEDIPMAEIISSFDDENAIKGLTGNNAIMVGLVENAGGRIARVELRKQWIDGEGKESSFRTTLKRSIEGGYLCKDENEEIFLPPITIDD